MPKTEIYVCDADCLINLYRHFRWKAIRALRGCMNGGDVKLPEGVVREILRGTDELAKLVREQQQHLCITTKKNNVLLNEIVRLERLYGEKIRFGRNEYPGFWKSKAGKLAADSQVVALAKLTDNGIAVSDDRAVKLACATETVPCIGWIEFARRLALPSGEQELNFDS
jgi:hypothetical protein